MPAPPLANTLEGGSNGVGINNANSGGASGDAFTNVVKTTSALDYSTDPPAHGLICAKYGLIRHVAGRSEPWLRTGRAR